MNKKTEAHKLLALLLTLVTVLGMLPMTAFAAGKWTIPWFSRQEKCIKMRETLKMRSLVLSLQSFTSLRSVMQ